MASDLIYREDAKVFVRHACYKKTNPIDYLDEVPAADVVGVVRCKDCKLMSHDEHGYWCINDYQASLDPEKDYCSRAVRRADNGN